MKKSTGEFTIIHHYPTTEEDFLQHQAELIADILYGELMKYNLTLKLDDEKEE